MSEKLAALVREEIGLVDHLFEEYEELLDKSLRAAPDKVEKAALATILHSFYNGLENIFSTIAREIDSRAVRRAITPPATGSDGCTDPG